MFYIALKLLENLNFIQDTYNFVLEKENIKSRDAMRVAANAWDIIGAQSAGLQTAFIQRACKFLYPNTKSPDMN